MSHRWCAQHCTSRHPASASPARQSASTRSTEHSTAQRSMSAELPHDSCPRKDDTAYGCSRRAADATVAAPAAMAQVGGVFGSQVKRKQEAQSACICRGCTHTRLPWCHTATAALLTVQYTSMLLAHPPLGLVYRQCPARECVDRTSVWKPHALFRRPKTD